MRSVRHVGTHPHRLPVLLTTPLAPGRELSPIGAIGSRRGAACATCAGAAGLGLRCEVLTMPAAAHPAPPSRPLPESTGGPAARRQRRVQRSVVGTCIDTFTAGIHRPCTRSASSAGEDAG